MELPPSPPAWPLLGHSVPFTRNPLKSLRRWAESHGPVVRLEFPGRRAVLVTAPELIKQVMEEESGVFSVGKAREEAFTGMEQNAMVVARGDDWVRMRNLMQKYFTPSNVMKYRHDVLEEVDRMIDDWALGEELDLYETMNRLMIRVVGRSLLGTDMKGRESVVRRAADAVVERSDLTNPLRTVPEWVPLPQTVRFRRARREVRELISEICEEKRAGESGDDLLSGLLRAHEAGELSSEELRDNVLSFFMAGSDTTAAALTYTFYCLGNHPSILNRLNSSARDYPVEGPGMLGELADDDTAFRHAVEEAMRLYPPAFSVGRMAVRDYELGNYQIPAGTQMILSQWVVQRDESTFDCPDEYRPQRWEHSDRWPEYAEFPFGGGERFCIGSHFAMMEMPIVVARLLQRVDLEVPTEEIREFIPAVTLRPAHPIQLRVRGIDN